MDIEAEPFESRNPTDAEIAEMADGYADGLGGGLLMVGKTSAYKHGWATGRRTVGLLAEMVESDFG